MQQHIDGRQQCGGIDGFPMTPYKDLDCASLQTLSTLFTDHLMTGTGQPDNWISSEVDLVPKIAAAAQLELTKIRLITRSVVQQKIFEKAMVSWAEVQIASKNKGGAFMANQLGSQRSVRGTEPLFLLRLAVERVRVFGRPLYVAKVDTKAAFDTITISSLDRGMRVKGVEQCERYALISGCINDYCRLRLQQAYSRPLKRCRGIKQGGPASMALFCWSFDTAISANILRWQSKQMGFHLADQLTVTNIQMADDFYVLADNWLSFTTMLQDLESTLEDGAGMLMSGKKFAWACNVEEAQDRSIELKCGSFPHTECIESLGTSLHIAGVMWPEVDRRIAKGWRCFFSISSLLMHPQAHLQGRLRLLASTVRQSMIYGLECATLHQADVRRLNFVYNTMVAKMMMIKQGDNEPWLDWHIRTLRCARRALHYSPSRCVAHAIYRAQWKFGQYLALAARVKHQRVAPLVMTLDNIKIYRSQRLSDHMDAFYHGRGRQVRFEEALQR